MYVGSSTGYNDTMSGETMSSISEKSGSYISDGGAGHDHQHQHHHHSTHHRHHIHHPTQPHLLHTTAVTTEFEVITFFVCYYTSLLQHMYTYVFLGYKNVFTIQRFYVDCMQCEHITQPANISVNAMVDVFIAAAAIQLITVFWCSKPNDKYIYFFIYT